MGVRLRTTLTATVAVAVALCLASFALFLALDSSLNASTRQAAAQDAKAKVGSLSSPPGPGLKEAARSWEEPSSHGSGDKDPGVVNIREGKITVREVIETSDGPLTVTGTASTAPARAAMTTLKQVLLPGVPALLALVALFTWLSVGRVLRPVSAIRAKLADITAHDLHERVPQPGTRDEIAALARTVNATLDRLWGAVDAHRQFVADAAHELRSPMAVLRTRLELAAPQDEQLAADALDDVERLQSLTADLLLLARLDAREPQRTSIVDLAQLVAEEATRVRPRPHVRVRLDLTPDLIVDGSPDRLRRLVANLVDNAVRHATTAVDVTLTPQGGQAALDVVDDGPGIPPRHHTTVFDRFTRLDHARTRDTGGSGLGLPIARDIAQAHDGTLRIIASDTGARLHVLLPLSEGAETGAVADRVAQPPWEPPDGAALTHPSP
ncbi:sensor histidine kinase [Streptomyces sp. NPDC127108]|uniref:sensor histidine kinase n=1 Tax=Streptomyces sp. NPDC127108 TaxID=3345361 RepID=UPI0036408165